MDFAREAARNVACPARRPLAIDSDLLLLLAISLAIAGDLLLLMAISWLRLPEGASPSGLWGPQKTRPTKKRCVGLRRGRRNPKKRCVPSRILFS